MKLLSKINKQQLRDAWSLWTKFCLTMLASMLVLRLVFFVELLCRIDIAWSKIGVVLCGFLYDLIFVGNIGIALLLPLLVIGYFSLRRGSKISNGLVITYAVITGMLAECFSNMARPLDHIIFAYTPAELVQTVFSSVSISIVPFLFLVIYVAVALLTIWLFKSVKFGTIANVLCVVFALIACIVPRTLVSFVKNESIFVTFSDYQLAANQFSFSCRKIIGYQKPGHLNYTVQGVGDAAKKYHALHAEHTYVDDKYPFMRMNDDKDVLGNFLNPTTNNQAPNFVFIIVESLGRKLSGYPNPKYSFTPFLDSIASQGLYWKNCLSTSERTFGVLPAMFASVPHGAVGFANRRYPVPDHNSLLNDLSSNGYYVSFFYGGAASFSGQDAFLKLNSVSYISDIELDTMTDARSAQQKEFYRWGLDDDELYTFAKQKKSEQTSSPFTDIYLTLSSHEPFNIPILKQYEEKILNTYKLDNSKEGKRIKKHLNIFSCFLYADESLRTLFDYYKSRPDFENTIFIITGDHRMAPLGEELNQLTKYNVPLIIYSKLIRQPIQMQGVVSHYDIVPSINAYLSKNYNYQMSQTCHWLGTSLDTSTTFRCKKRQAFMLNNRDVEEYLQDSYAVAYGRLFSVQEDLVLTPIDDAKLLDSLQKEFNAYQLLSEYAVDNNFLKPHDIPGSVTLCQIHDGFEKCDSIFIDEKHNAWCCISPLQVFVPLASVELPKHCKGVECNVQFDVKNIKKHNQLPKIVYRTRNSNKYYKQRPLQDFSGRSLNTGNSETFSQRIVIPFDEGIDKDEFFDIYLWNNDWDRFLIDNLNIVISEKK